MTNHIIKILNEKYGYVLYSINKINVGYVNDIYKIDTNRGSFILKVYNLFEDGKRELSISVQRYISKKLLSPIIFIEEYGDNSFIVQQYLEDKQEEFSWYTYGQNLGILHSYLKEYKEIEVKDFSPIPCNDIEILIRKESDSIKKELLVLKKYMLPLFSRPEISDKQIIHGDYRRDNVIFHNNKCYTIDYDEVKKYYVLYDVGKIIFNILFERKSTLEKWEKIDEFLFGYRKVKELATDEREQFFNILGYTLVNDMSGIIDTGNKDYRYTRKRLLLHKKLNILLHEKDDIMRRLRW